MPHLPDFPRHISTHVFITRNDAFAFVLRERFQLQLLVGEKPDGAMEEVEQQLALDSVRGNEALGDGVGEETQRLENDRVLEKKHLTPVFREDA